MNIRPSIVLLEFNIRLVMIIMTLVCGSFGDCADKGAMSSSVRDSGEAVASVSLDCPWLRDGRGEEG